MNKKSGDTPEAEQEEANANGMIEKLAKYDEVLNNKALAFVDIDLNEGLVEGV